MTIDPKVSLILNILVALVGTFLSLGAEFTGLFGADTAKEMIQYGGYVAMALGALNSLLHGVSAPVSGPLTKGTDHA